MCCVCCNCINNDMIATLSCYAKRSIWNLFQHLAKKLVLSCRKNNSLYQRMHRKSQFVFAREEIESRDVPLHLLHFSLTNLGVSRCIWTFRCFSATGLPRFNALCAHWSLEKLSVGYILSCSFLRALHTPIFDPSVCWLSDNWFLFNLLIAVWPKWYLFSLFASISLRSISS